MWIINKTEKIGTEGPLIENARIILLPWELNEKRETERQRSKILQFQIS